MRDERRIQVCVVDHALWRVGSVELRDVDRQTPVLLKRINDIPRSPQIGKPILRAHQLHIVIVPRAIRLFDRVVMPGHKIHRDAVLPAVLHESADPDLIRAAADCGTAHAEPAVHRLDRVKRLVEEPEVLLHVRILPESAQIRLIPHLDRPCQNLLRTITAHQVAQQTLHHLTPHPIIARRGRISLPVKDRLCAARKLLRHEAQLQKRPQPHTPVKIHHPVQICIIILYLPDAVLLIFMIYRHIITEQAMSPDMLKSDLRLHQFQLLLVLLCQGKPHAPCADAEIHMILKKRFRIPVHCNSFFLWHTLLHIVCAILIDPKTCSLKSYYHYILQPRQIQ